MLRDSRGTAPNQAILRPAMPSRRRTSIEHVVVLMLENRSFDHMCGWFGRGDGLTPNTFNREDPADPRSPVARSTRNAAYVGDFSIDAGHSLLDVNEQLFGGPVPREASSRSRGRRTLRS